MFSGICNHRERLEKLSKKELLEVFKEVLEYEIILESQ